MGRLAIAWLLGAGITATPPDTVEWSRFQFARTEMAVPVKITFYATDPVTANAAAEAAFDRIRQLNGILSDYDPNSELRRLCDTAGEGKAIRVSQDLWNVLCRAQAIAVESEGAFDVTVGPIVRLWRRARRQKELPPADMLSDALNLVGYRLIRMDPRSRTVELEKPAMRLDLGGIAKGYAVDAALAILGEHGITQALVDAGGDIGLGEPPPEARTVESRESRHSPPSTLNRQLPTFNTGWRIGVAGLQPPSEESPPRYYLLLSRSAIATSGDVWQYVVIDGKRYSHLIDPRTGIGLTDHSSVTVVAPDATTADALASAVSVLGPEKGLRLVDNTPGAAALILRAPESRIETYQSQRWKQLPVASAESR